MAYSILVIDDEALTLRTIGRALKRKAMKSVWQCRAKKG